MHGTIAAAQLATGPAFAVRIRKSTYAVQAATGEIPSRLTSHSAA